MVQGGQKLGRVESAIYTTRLVRIPIPELIQDGGYRLEFDHDYTGLPRAVQRQLGVPRPIELVVN